MPSVRSRSLSVSKPSSRRAVKTSRRAQRRSSRQMASAPYVHCRAHHYWMVATLGAFPIGLSLAAVAGLGSVLSFIVGALASLLVLLLNILLEHEFWMFDAHWRVRFEDPDFSHRLLVVSGALLLMIQTSFLVFFILDQPFAEKVFRLFVTARV